MSLPDKSSSELTPPRRRRYQPRRPPPKLPATLRYGRPIIGLVLAGVFGWPHLQALWRSFMPQYAQLQVTDVNGQALPKVQLEIFVWDETHYAPSPSPLLTRLAYSGPTGVPMKFSAAQIPERALLRVSCAGYGCDYVSLTLGDAPTTLSLGSPVSLEGGVSSSNGAPLRGVQIQAFAGGRRGVVLAEGTSDLHGQYHLQGYSSQVGELLLRVTAAGYQLQEKHWVPHPYEPIDLDFKLKPVPPILGQIHVPAEVSAADLQVCVFNQPGLLAKVRADGSFVLHGLGPDRKHRLLLYNLPEGYTHRKIILAPGQRFASVRVDQAKQLRGRLLRSGNPVVGANVYHEHCPQGREIAVTDATGEFILHSLPTGEVELRASIVRASKVRASRGQASNVPILPAPSLMVTLPEQGDPAPVEFQLD